MKKDIEVENKNYWLKRAPGYSQVNKEELEGIQHKTWAKLLDEEIQIVFGNRNRDEIKIADIGAGPGFISIILAELGYSVTAVDFAETMIEEAKRNAKEHKEKITFINSDACATPFSDEAFDVIFSRNLTWNLQNPDKAYKEWLRILKPGGLMLIFDANWYSYLINEEKRKAYELDRLNVASLELEDYNIGENFDQMEKIASHLPMTRLNRPMWDEIYLSALGNHKITIINNVGEIVYSNKEKINYSSTPLFMVRLEKGMN